jgi:hypothetical protein
VKLTRFLLLYPILPVLLHVGEIVATDPDESTTSSGTKVMHPVFRRKCNCNKTDIYVDDSQNFSILRLFFHKVSVTFNTLLPTFSTTLCTSAVKFPASTSQHITKTSFQFPVTCKMASTQCNLYRAKQVTVGRRQIWAVSRTGKNDPYHFCYCVTCTQVGVRLGIVVKEKDVFYVSVMTNCVGALSHFLKFLCASRDVL